MRRLVLIFFLLISIVSSIKIQAQSVLPLHEGESRQYAAYIEMARGYISGVCVLQKTDKIIKGCLFNEFGITSLDFTYDTDRKKVKLHHVVKMMDKWYIRRVLRKDIALLMLSMEEGKTKYENEHRHITYQLNPMEDELTE